MASGSVTDPVCGMLVSADEGVELVYEGAELRFCSESCRQEFLRHPRVYLDIPRTLTGATTADPAARAR